LHQFMDAAADVAIYTHAGPPGALLLPAELIDRKPSGRVSV
jgi:hypothetical protein